MDNDKRKQTWMAWYVVTAVSGILFVHQIWDSAKQTEAIPYSEFDQLVSSHKIAEAIVGSDMIEGKLKEPASDGKTKFVTVPVDPAIADKLAAEGVKVSGAPPTGFIGTILAWTVPAIILYFLWVFLFRRFAGGQGLTGLTSVGKSRAKVYVETDTKVTFKNVAGVDEAKFELQEVVAFLKNLKSFGRLGAHAPKGILLVGPPGTGKTLVARAVAGEAGVSFFSISGSEFVEMFIGVGAACVRDLFQRARKAAPCIFSSMNSMLLAARARQADSAASTKRKTLNQLLAELDGFDPSIGVILLAATNRPEILDPALLRAGRFDRQVLVDRPDRKGRLEILKVHMKKIPLDPKLDLDRFAAMTTGFTGADLANLVNEAAIVATRRNSTHVAFEDVTAAIERIVAGIEKKSRILTPSERRRVAYHEMGHALVAASLPGVDPVLKVSIIPRGVGALGYTIQHPPEDRFLLAASELRNRIAVLMGGRAAEVLLFEGDVSTGAADDLQRATDIATEMVTLYGMEEAVTTLREIDLSVRDILSKAFEEARGILTARRGDLDRGAELLLSKEVITSDDFPPLQQARAGESLRAAAVASA